MKLVTGDISIATTLSNYCWREPLKEHFAINAIALTNCILLLLWLGNQGLPSSSSLPEDYLHILSFQTRLESNDLAFLMTWWMVGNFGASESICSRTANFIERCIYRVFETYNLCCEKVLSCGSCRAPIKLVSDFKIAGALLFSCVIITSKQSKNLNANDKPITINNVPN